MKEFILPITCYQRNAIVWALFLFMFTVSTIHALYMPATDDGYRGFCFILSLIAGIASFAGLAFYLADKGFKDELPSFPFKCRCKTRI